MQIFLYVFYRFKFLSNGRTPGFFNWAENEPNNSGVGGKQEDCVSIGYDGTNKWNDDYCGYKYPYVCEFWS